MKNWFKSYNKNKPFVKIFSVTWIYSSHAFFQKIVCVIQPTITSEYNAWTQTI